MLKLWESKRSIHFMFLICLHFYAHRLQEEEKEIRHTTAQQISQKYKRIEDFKRYKADQLSQVSEWSIHYWFIQYLFIILPM